MSRYIGDILSYFTGRKVSDELKERVHRHLLSSKDDPAALEAMKQIWDSLDDERADEASVDKAYNAIAARLSLHTKQRMRWHKWLKVAVMWVIPLFVTGVAAIVGVDSYNQREAIASVEILSHFTASGERDSLLLPDGTKIWLNGGSTIMYPSDFANATRKVALVGEAYFDVEKGEKPFVVDVNGMSVQVLGTRFNLTAYPQDSKVIATLATGSIAATFDDIDEKYVLKPSEQLVYDRTTGKVAIGRVTTESYTSWHCGVVTIDDTRFEEVVRILEQAYGVEIHVRNKSFNNEVLHAHFSISDNIEDVLEVVKMLIPGMSYTKEGRDIYID